MGPSVPQAARLLVHRPDGRFLAVNRRLDPQILCLPGGKVDPDETPEAAAVRELWEETGVSLASDALTFLYVGPATNDHPEDPLVYRVWTFHAPWPEGAAAPRTCEPGIHPRWVDAPEFAQRCMRPAYDHQVLAAWHALAG